MISGSVVIDGRVLRAGDFHHADEDSHHGEITTSEGAEVLLVGAIDDYLPAASAPADSPTGPWIGRHAASDTPHSAGHVSDRQSRIWLRNSLRCLFVRAGLTASQGGPVKSLLMFWFTRVIAVSFCAAGAFASDGRARRSLRRLLQDLNGELNALAQQQLDRRALTIAAIRDLPAAATRQAEVRRRRPHVNRWSP